MNVRAPEILSRLIGHADAMIRDQDNGSLRQDERRGVELEQIYGELVVMVEEAPLGEGRELPDDCALMLTQCLMKLNLRCGPLGETEQATKWAQIAKHFLTWVRTDLARGLDILAHPATTDQDYAKRRPA